MGEKVEIGTRSGRTGEARESPDGQGGPEGTFLARREFRSSAEFEAPAPGLTEREEQNSASRTWWPEGETFSAPEALAGESTTRGREVELLEKFATLSDDFKGRIQELTAEEAREKLLRFTSMAKEGFKELKGICEARAGDASLEPSERAKFRLLANVAGEGAKSMELIGERAKGVGDTSGLRSLLALALGVGEVLFGLIGLALGVPESESLGLITSGLELLIGLNVC